MKEREVPQLFRSEISYSIIVLVCFRGICRNNNTTCHLRRGGAVAEELEQRHLHSTTIWFSLHCLHDFEVIVNGGKSGMAAIVINQRKIHAKIVNSGI